MYYSVLRYSAKLCILYRHLNYLCSQAEDTIEKLYYCVPTFCSCCSFTTTFLSIYLLHIKLYGDICFKKIFFTPLQLLHESVSYNSICMLIRKDKFKKLVFSPLMENTQSSPKMKWNGPSDMVALSATEYRIYVHLMYTCILRILVLFNMYKQ